MASWQSEAVADLYRTWTSELNNPDPERQEPRETNDHWGDLTAEPRGVDYLEREAAGGEVLWVQPRGAREDRVLFYLHGGGFVGGSIYTHRKLVGHLARQQAFALSSCRIRIRPSTVIRAAEPGRGDLPLAAGAGHLRWPRHLRR